MFDDNGVQYNGCYELTDICECNKEDGFCNDNPNCYYKQLMRTNNKLNKIKKVCNKFIPDYYKILLIINDGIIDEEIR